MRLLGSFTSPFVRKVRIAAFEKGLADHIAFEALSPYEDPAPLLAANPLAKVPALLLDNGETLFDSRVIVEYLDGLVPEPVLIPASGPERFAVLRRQAVCDGVTDAAVAIVMENRRPGSERSHHWMTRWRAAIDRGVIALASETPMLGPDFRLDAIATAAMLGYLDFRLPDIDWRVSAAGLARWFETAAQRDSVASTAPPRA